MRRFLAKFVNVFRRRRAEMEMTREIESHLALLEEDFERRGLSPEEAKFAARRAYGNVGQVKELHRDARSLVWIEQLTNDVNYAWRNLWHNPGFALVTVITLALGIGGSTGMFALIRSVLLRPLEYRESGQLVYLSTDNIRRRQNDIAFTLIRLEQIRASAQSFTGIGAFLNSPEDVTLSGGDPETLKGARVSANFLDVLGIQPKIGRSFLPDEETPGGRAVAMISTALWKRRFSGNPQLLGETVSLDSIPHIIIGVLPEGFAFPFADVDVWVTKPSQWSRVPPQYWRTLTLLKGFARLKKGITVEQIRAEVDVLNRQYLRAHPDFGAEAGLTMRVEQLKDRLVANVRPILLMLFGAVIFVLLIACANVGGLMLARAASRSREFAIRAAVGASRFRMIRQLLIESLVLASLGGAVGVLLAKYSFTMILPTHAFDNSSRGGALSVPGSGASTIDSVVLGFTVLLSITTGILFGLFPSLRMSRPAISNSLRDSGATAGRSSSRTRAPFGLTLRSATMIGQVALSVILLIGSALLLKSLVRLRNVDPGFSTAGLLTAKIPLPPKRYDTDQKKIAFVGELVKRVEGVPGIDSAAVAMSLPTTPWVWTNIQVQGRPPTNRNETQEAQIQSITPEYFRTLRIPTRRGRAFTIRDNMRGAAPVAIINEKFARQFWPSYPNEDPIGQFISVGADKSVGRIEIVGVASSVREGGLAFDAGPEFYVPTVVHPFQTLYLVVRTEGNPLLLINAIRAQVLTIDLDQSIADVKVMQALYDAGMGPRRLTMVLLGSFAGIALLLAAIGLYGIIAYSVQQRTQEIGIRQALGAQRGDVLRLILSQTMRLVLSGLLVGIAGAFCLTRIMENLLFRVSATDPSAFVAISLLFIAVALAASYIPARRATQIDPMGALRVT